jgi:hypothetical protein
MEPIPMTAEAWFSVSVIDPSHIGTLSNSLFFAHLIKSCIQQRYDSSTEAENFPVTHQPN